MVRGCLPKQPVQDGERAVFRPEPIEMATEGGDRARLLKRNTQRDREGECESS